VTLLGQTSTPTAGIWTTRVRASDSVGLADNSRRSRPDLGRTTVRGGLCVDVPRQGSPLFADLLGEVGRIGDSAGSVFHEPAPQGPSAPRPSREAEGPLEVCEHRPFPAPVRERPVLVTAMRPGGTRRALSRKIGARRGQSIDDLAITTDFRSSDFRSETEARLRGTLEVVAEGVSTAGTTFILLAPDRDPRPRR